MPFRHHETIPLRPSRRAWVNTQHPPQIQSSQDVGGGEVAACVPELGMMGHRHCAQANPIRLCPQPRSPLFRTAHLFKDIHRFFLGSRINRSRSGQAHRTMIQSTQTCFAPNAHAQTLPPIIRDSDTFPSVMHIYATPTLSIQDIRNSHSSQLDGRVLHSRLIPALLKKCKCEAALTASHLPGAQNKIFNANCIWRGDIFAAVDETTPNVGVVRPLPG